jgi:hypothetical protein
MRVLVRTVVVGCLGAWLALGCGGKEATPQAPGADVAADKASAAKLAGMSGRVRLNDVALPVAPIVIHEPRMDLATSCKLKRDAADSQPATLCYDEKKQAVADVTRLRVEQWPKARGGAAIRVLSAHDEAAHFVVEGNGSVTQLLDMAYPARRSGEYRRGEVRVVVMGDGKAADALVEALGEHLPAATVERLAVTPPPPPKREPAPEKAPDADAGVGAGGSDAGAAPAPDEGGE